MLINNLSFLKTQIRGSTKWIMTSCQDILNFLPIARSEKYTYKPNSHLCIKKVYEGKIHTAHTIKNTHKSWLKIQAHFPNFLILSSNIILIMCVHHHLSGRLRGSLCLWKFSSKPGTTENLKSQSEPRTLPAWSSKQRSPVEY